MAERLKRIVAINEEYYYIAHVCRGMALGLRGRLKERLEEMGQAIVAEPGEYDGYFWQGMLRAFYYRQQAHEQETIAVIEKALEIGLPPVLLLPRYWLEVDQPDFFTRCAKPLLERMDV